MPRRFGTSFASSLFEFIECKWQQTFKFLFSFSVNKHALRNISSTTLSPFRLPPSFGMNNQPDLCNLTIKQLDMMNKNVPQFFITTLYFPSWQQNIHFWSKGYNFMSCTYLLVATVLRCLIIGNFHFISCNVTQRNVWHNFLFQFLFSNRHQPPCTSIHHLF